MTESLKLRLIKNASWLFSAEVISKILAYGLIVLLGRTLGEEGLGQYSFIFSFVALTSIFSDLGVSFYVMREIARDKSKTEDIFPYALGLKIVLALINFGIIVALASQLNKPSWIKALIYLVAFENILFVISNIFIRLMFAYEVTKYEAIAKALERSWAFFIGGSILYFKRQLTPFIIALVVGYYLRESLRVYWGSRFLDRLKMKFDVRAWLEILKHSYPFWLIGLFIIIYYRTDIVMLGLLKSDYDVGVYRGAYTLIEVPMFIPSIVISTTLPSMARLWKEDRKTLGVLFKKSFQVLALIGIVGTLGFYFLSDFAIRIVFGSGFRESVGVLKILGFAVPFMFLNSLFGSLLNATGRELTFTKITAFTAFVNVVLNYFLIQGYSYYGAAVATVMSTGIQCLLMFHISKISKFLS
jgi:O-antigen/teichoic acid export membrane protein